MTQHPSSSQAVCYGKCESTHVLDNESTVEEVCREFFPGGSEGMLSATCSFHRSFHSQEDISIDDFFWDNLGPLSGGKESPWEEYFWSANDSPSLLPPPPPTPARRQRTKFTEKQVAAMEEFARASGWRRRKRDRASIIEFCQGIDVDPGKYKTWLKNRKQAAHIKRG